LGGPADIHEATLSRIEKADDIAEHVAAEPGGGGHDEDVIYVGLDRRQRDGLRAQGIELVGAKIFEREKLKKDPVVGEEAESEGVIGVLDRDKPLGAQVDLVELGAASA